MLESLNDHELLATAQAQSLNAQSAVASALTLAGPGLSAKQKQQSFVGRRQRTRATNELLFALNVAQKWKKSDPCRRVYVKKE